MPTIYDYSTERRITFHNKFDKHTFKLERVNLLVKNWYYYYFLEDALSQT